MNLSTNSVTIAGYSLLQHLVVHESETYAIHHTAVDGPSLAVGGKRDRWTSRRAFDAASHLEFPALGDCIDHYSALWLLCAAQGERLME
jgi:hypothetical protein